MAERARSVPRARLVQCRICVVQARGGWGVNTQDTLEGGTRFLFGFRGGSYSALGTDETEAGWPRGAWFHCGGPARGSTHTRHTRPHEVGGVGTK